MPKHPKKFIQKAIQNPGALTKKAKAQGLTPAQFCDQPNLSAKSQKQCNLRKTLVGLNKKKSK